MERHLKQLANTLVLASALIAAVATFLLPPSLQAQTQAQPNNIDPALLTNANTGDAKAQFKVGLLYDHGQGVSQDYVQAAAWYRKAAEQGLAEAQYNLGQDYIFGTGVPKNETKAVFWYRKAAEQGEAKAQTTLGYLYFNGWGVPQDYAQAVAWYRKAAEKCEAEAQWRLGYLYFNGWGVPQDFAEAYFWYDLAAAGKLDAPFAKDVATFRDAIASHLTPADLSREQERARKWFEAHQAKP